MEERHDLCVKESPDMGCTPSILLNHKSSNDKDSGSLFFGDNLDQQSTDLVSKEKDTDEDFHEALHPANEKVIIFTHFKTP